MTAVFTNRLIGSAILVIAAVVFLPDLLDGQKQVNKDDFKAIPERPEFAEVAQPAVFSQDQHQAAKNAATAPILDDSQALDLPQATNADLNTAAQPSVDAVNTNAANINATSLNTDPDPQPTSKEQMTSAGPTPVETTNIETAKLADQKLPTEKVPVTPVPVEKVVEVKAEKPLSQAAYVVKVGSFSKEQNANALVSKLKAAGHNAFSRKIVNGQGVTMVSVLVGPDLKKDKLEARLIELQQLSQVPKLRVSSYQPVENN